MGSALLPFLFDGKIVYYICMELLEIFYQTSPLFLALSISILVVTILLAVVLVSIGGYAWRRIFALKKEAGKEEKTAEIEAEHILADAHKEAVEIVRTAAEKAQEILKSAEVIKQETIENLSREITAISEQHQRYLKDASLKYVETYEHMAERAQEEYLNTLHAASQSMAQDAKQTLGMFETFLKDQTVGYKQAMERKIEELRKQVNEYVHEYKKDKLQRVDNVINEIIVSVAKSVIGRSLNIKEHNELVLKALDEAKKEGFFSHLDL